MSNFDLAFKKVMGNEGGYNNDPKDRGGETYKGISRNNWPLWGGWNTIDFIKAQYGKSAATINKYAGADQGLQASVKQFYQINFWYTLSLQLINDQQLANNVFDFNVNSGSAAKKLQIAVNSVVGAGTLLVDGKIGSKTISTINKLDAEKVYDAFNAERKKYYDIIIERDPSQAVFKNSWYNRIIPYEKAK